MHVRFASITGIFLSLALVLPVQAATFKQADNLSVDVPVGDNLYVAGSTVSVTQPIEGDLVVAGGNVRVQGSVANTLQAAGGHVTVLAPVAHSARIAGGTISISSDVGEDLIIAGGDVTIQSGAVIHGDLIVFGGNVTIDGTVEGKLEAAGGSITINGSVVGPARVNAQRAVMSGTFGDTATIAANSLTLGEGSAFAQDVRYWREGGEMDFGPSLKEGSAAVFDPSMARTSQSKAYETAKWTGIGIVALFSIYSLLSSLLVLILFLLLGHGFFKKAGDVVSKKPWMSLLYGFLYAAATPALILLLAVTIIGIPVALFVLFAYIFSFIFGAVITALILTRWIEIHFRNHWGLWMYVLIGFFVWLALKVIMFVPFLGWIAGTMFLFMAFGGCMQAITMMRKKKTRSRS